MPDRKMLLITGTVAAVTLLIAGGAYVFVQQSGDRFAQCRASTVAGGLDSFGTDFTLTRDDGQRVTADEVFTRPTLLYFGYTFCPDVCPLDTARNAEAQALLAEQGRDVQTVFITVDPARDTPQVLADFTDLFSDDMIGLTGSTQEIAAVNKGWRNYFKLHDDQDDEYYLVDHMTHTYLVMPGNRTVEFFRREVTPQQMAEGVGCFLDAAS
ncbi:SCO family protein [Paracoccus stylophorae]|nr:SCO family protein [Paracoccus stylophorae]